MTTLRFVLGVSLAVGLASPCPAWAQPTSQQTAPPTAQPAAPPARPARQYDTDTFFRTISMSGASFSADGSWLLVTSDESGVPNAWRVSLPDGERTPLTSSPDTPTYTLGTFPADDRILVTADGQGNELNHLLVREPDGRLVDITPGDALKASFLGWGADDESFYVATNERDEKYFDLYRYAIPEAAADADADAGAGSYARTLVYTNTGYDLAAVSGDGRWVALRENHDNADNDILLWDARAPEAEPRLLTPHEGDVDHGVEAFDPDGERLYYTSDVDHEFHRVWSVPVDGGEATLEVDADWDVSFYRFSRDGRFALYGVNADGRTEVTVLDASTGARVALPDVPAGAIQGATFEVGGAHMAWFVNGDTSPSHLHLADLATGKTTRLVNTLAPEVDERDLVASTVVRYPSFDGLEIPALLYKPHQATDAHPVPAIVYVHGGPGGQTRVGYNASFQHLLNHGYAILAVNNRGSSGYGKTFFHLDDRRHGEVDLADCVAARAWLEQLSWVDGERVGIMGGSYGGYMVAAALAFEPQAFDVGLDIFGVTNWLRTLESIPPWWADFRDSLYAEMGDPATDRERLVARSPLFHAKHIVKPLLVVQGANDPRVLQAESDELVAAVRANDVPVEYVLFDDEGHGFRQRKNRIAASDAYLAFLDTYLRGTSAD